MEKVKPIILHDNENNEDYTLEFSRESIRFAEARGFSIADVEKYPMTKLPELFFYAFRMHHKNVSREKTDRILFDDLGADECVVTGLTEGSGTVMCAHGELPVPVPAVLNIAAATGIPLRPSETKGECVTPTGIALAAAFRTRSELPPAYRVLGVGTGLGKRDYGRPAILRILRIEAV